MSRNNKRAANLTGTVRSNAQSKADARARAAQLAKEQQRKESRKRTLVFTLAGVLVAALVVGGTLFALSRSGGPVSTPPAATVDGGFVVGSADARVTVEVVEDFQCPACQAFEESTSELLDEFASGDQVNVEYRGIAFLDRASSTDYSSRSLNASACVMGEGAEVWTEFHRQLFVQQPAEGGEGLPDSELVSIAVAAGADEATVSSCVEDSTYADWVDATTERAGDEGVDSTPTILVDGEPIAENSADALQAAVDAALAS